MSNILPKKSWHVGNDKNIARVKKDEQEDRFEREKLEEKATSAAHEHRLSLLRKRAAESQTQVDEVNEAQEEYSVKPIKDEAISRTERFTLFEESELIDSHINAQSDKNDADVKNHSSTPHNKIARKAVKSEHELEKQHLKHDPLAQQLLKSRSMSQIKFDQKWNTSQNASKQIINKNQPLDRRIAREQRERAREEELLKKRKLGK